MPDWQKKGLKAPEVCPSSFFKLICITSYHAACIRMLTHGSGAWQKKVERKAYEDKGVVPLDQPLDDPVEEKLRKQK